MRAESPVFISQSPRAYYDRRADVTFILYILYTADTFDLSDFAAAATGGPPWSSP